MSSSTKAKNYYNEIREEAKRIAARYVDGDRGCDPDSGITVDIDPPEVTTNFLNDLNRLYARDRRRTDTRLRNDSRIGIDDDVNVIEDGAMKIVHSTITGLWKGLDRAKRMSEGIVMTNRVLIDGQLYEAVSDLPSTLDGWDVTRRNPDEVGLQKLIMTSKTIADCHLLYYVENEVLTVAYWIEGYDLDSIDVYDVPEDVLEAVVRDTLKDVEDGFKSILEGLSKRLSVVDMLVCWDRDVDTEDVVKGIVRSVTKVVEDKVTKTVKKIVKE